MKLASKNIILKVKFKTLLLLLFLSLLSAAFFLVPKNFSPSAGPTPEIPSTPSAQIKPSPSPQVFHLPVSGKQIKVPILLYHYIGNNPDQNDKARDNLSVSPDEFDKQMGYLSQNGFNPITLDTMMAGLLGITNLPPKPVVITFDDGYTDLYHNAYKILRKYNFRAVAFIPTGLVGTKYYASWEMLSEMQASGLLFFESHGVTHSDLASMSSAQLEQELTESKNILQAKFGIPVNFVAYPYGTSNSLVWEAAKKAGYVGGLGTWPSSIQSEGTIYNMPRIKINGAASMEDFAQKL